MTKQRDALARARDHIAIERFLHTDGDDGPVTIFAQSHIDDCDQTLALIDAALAEPEAPDVERIARAIADAAELCVFNDGPDIVANCPQNECTCLKQARAVAAFDAASEKG